MTDVFDALADAKRRRILEMLANKSMTTAAINKSLRLSATALDKQLKILLAAELVSVEKKGKTSTYSLNRKGLLEAAKWFGKFGASFVSGQADALGENLANLLTSAAGWLEAKVGGKINLDFDPEQVGKELGKKLSEAKTGATNTVNSVKAKKPKK